MSDHVGHDVCIIKKPDNYSGNLKARNGDQDAYRVGNHGALIISAPLTLERYIENNY